MGKVSLTIDNKKVEAETGMTVVEAARCAGIEIPTLCHHEKLKPYTACRLCLVEIESRGRVSLDTACSYPVRDDLVVRTNSAEITEIRRTLLELMLSHAPESRELQDYAKEYDAKKTVLPRRPLFVSIAPCV